MVDEPPEGVRVLTIWFSPVVKVTTQVDLHGVFALTLRVRTSDGGPPVSGPLVTFADADAAVGAVRSALADPKTGRFHPQMLAELALVRMVLVEGTIADWRACLMAEPPNRIALTTPLLSLTGWRIVPNEAHRFDAGTPMLPLLTAIADA